jgi:excinuclease ABC subunit B
MYADRLTDSMQRAISETDRRRAKQLAYNEEHGLTPQTIRKTREEILQATLAAGEQRQEKVLEPDERPWEKWLQEDRTPAELITLLQDEMESAASNLEFEKAALLRDRIEDLRAQWGLPVRKGPGEKS